MGRSADRAIYQEVIERCKIDEWPCCEKCGSNKKVEIHHIKFRSQGGKTELDNLIALCRVHHLEEHGLR